MNRRSFLGSILAAAVAQQTRSLSGLGNPTSTNGIYAVTSIGSRTEPFVITRMVVPQLFYGHRARLVIDGVKVDWGERILITNQV